MTRLFDFLQFIGYKTGHMRPHNTGVSKYSPTSKLVSAKVILKKVAIITSAASAASAASILVNKTQGRSPPPTPSPPGRDRQVAKIRRLRDGKGGGRMRWRGVSSCWRVCSVVLQRAPLKRSIPSLALPWLPPPTTQKLGAHPLQHDFAPHLPRPPYLALAPM